MKKILSAILATVLLFGASFALLSFNASAADKAELNVKWNDGYVVISPNNPYGLDDFVKSSNYSSTDVFTVPKAGTRLTWTDSADSKFLANTALSVSNWKQENGVWVLDKEKPMFTGASGKYIALTESATLSGSTVTSITYTYITDTDNENLRLCVAGTGAGIKVYSEELGLSESSWDKALALYPDTPSAPVSDITSAPIDAKLLEEELKWNYGYVGSTTHSSYPNQIKQGELSYVYSSVFTVPKAGTTVYFFDSTVKDAGDAQYASANAAIFSFWQKSGNNWVMDSSKESINGTNANQMVIGSHKMYWYTTTSDNENLRLCYRAGVADYSLPIKTFDIYLEEPVNMTEVTVSNVLTDTSYTDGSGNKINFKIYLPEGYKNSASCKLLFNFSSKTDIIDALIADKTDAVIVSFSGSTRECEKLVDAVVEAYDLNPYFMYMIGSAELASSIGKAFSNYILSTKTYSSPLDEGKALLAAQPNYYGILDQITMYAIGDSYFGGYTLGKLGTWVNRMGNKYGMHYINYGVDGSTMSNYVTNKNPMVDRYMNMEKGDADVILLEGGRNDRTLEAPIGTNDSHDTKTLLGAANTIIDGLLKTYPNALIIVVTPWYQTAKVSATGLSNIDYANALRDLVAYRNDPRIVCLYAADKDATGVNMSDANFRAQYCLSPTDASHLNLDGMKMIQPYMEKFIATELAKFKGLTLNGEEIVEDTSSTPLPEDTSSPDVTTQITDTSAELENNTSRKGCSSVSFFAPVVTVIVSAFALAIVFKKKF